MVIAAQVITFFSRAKINQCFPPAPPPSQIWTSDGFCAVTPHFINVDIILLIQTDGYILFLNSQSSLMSGTQIKQGRAKTSRRTMEKLIVQIRKCFHPRPCVITLLPSSLIAFSICLLGFFLLLHI